MNWIDSVLKGTDHVETPRPFIRWSLFTAISAVASPNVWFNHQGAYDLYPNIYVMLLSESGVGKGFGVWLAKQLVISADTTRVFSGRNTIQKIVSDLALVYTRKGKQMVKDGRGFLASGEFVNFLLRDEQGISILTEWYDTHYVRDWPNSLKSSGTERIKDVNITLLGGSTFDYLRESVPMASIKGGFFGRLLLVYAYKKSKHNALVDEATEDYNVKEERIKEWARYLIEISKIPRGSQFRLEDKAKDYYKEWYYPLQIKIESNAFEDRTGYIHRIHNHAMKIAMILSLSEGLDLVIQKYHIEEGIELAESLRSTVKKATIGIGFSTAAPQNEAFLRTLFTSPNYTLSRREVLQINHNEFSSNELDKVALTMEDAGFVKAQGNGDEAEYILTPMGRKQFIDVDAEMRGKR